VQPVEASDHVRDVVIELVHSTAKDTVKLTVLAVEKVEWLKPGPDPVPIEEANDHPDPAARVGLKWYPDAGEPQGAWNDQVKVRVTIRPGVSDQRVYLRVFDPDDPSADDNEVDPDGQTPGGDGTVGHDNRDQLRGTLWSTTGLTTGSTFTTLFTMAHQPGDNHRVAAVVLDEWLLDELNDNNVPGSDDELFSFVGGLSPLLTVWRRLHMDVDTMDEITGNYLEGEVLAVEHLPLDPKGPRTNLSLSDFEPNSFDENHHFYTVTRAKGHITLSKPGYPVAGPLDVLDNDEHWGQEALYVDLDTGLDTYAGGDYLLWDDDGDLLEDGGTSPITLPLGEPPNMEVLRTALKEAYITVEQDGAMQVSTFRLNVEMDELAWASQNLNAPSRSQWWVAHVTAALQGPHEEDYDELRPQGDGEGSFTMGATLLGQSAFCYLEVIRERADGGSAKSFDQLVGEDIAHEVGHEFGLEHRPYGNLGVYPLPIGQTYLMAGEEDLSPPGSGGANDRDHDTHEPPAIAAIRATDHPLVDP
jgi:hypothetical protein